MQGGDTPEALEALLARARSLHLQAQAEGGHSKELRLEMATRAQKMLEMLIGQLTAAGHSHP